MSPGAGKRSLLAFVLLALAGAGMAGCLGADDDAGADPGAATQTAPEPWAVVALVDTGINPYHVDFRLPGPLADVHPSLYIPGYPADIPAVNLTLNATDLDKALEADNDTWHALKPGQPYWFRGTKVTGVSFFEPGSLGDDAFIFSTGHGSMVASKAGGNAYSLCPTCHVVGAQGFTGEAVVWVSEQPWIDVQSNSWGPVPAFAWVDRTAAVAPVLTEDPELDHKFEAAAAQQAVFVAAGNGIGGAFGVVGFPSPTDSTSGSPGVIAVGGHDNGKTTLWSAWLPHVVADACSNWAMVGDSVEDYGDSEGGGTSAASPYSAGGAARLILEARRILNSTSPRDVAAGVYAKAPEGAVLPQSGPLADGDLTLAELKHTLFHTATPTPSGDDASGAECGAASPYWTGVSWSTVPHGVPIYPWVGYGEVSIGSIAFGINVLGGQVAPYERTQSDDLYALDQEARAFYHHLV